ncbi:uncharacterized protein C1orf21 homolog isoform X1 [Muntiacus reevesi]|uniref:uncharacterized protein C1orf21 homolog isoform X1 n=1 Tax=Muntiacus reevesi TaxID=9886 RepID=UPI0033074C84
MRLWAVPPPSMLPLFKMKRKPRKGRTTRTEMCLAKVKNETHGAGECSFASTEEWSEDNISQKLEDFADEYRIKPVEEVKYMKNGAEEEQKIAARNQENLEKSASSNVRLKTNKEIPGLVHQPRANMHISESQQEFFRMLDEKIEKGRDYCSEEEDIT